MAVRRGAHDAGRKERGKEEGRKDGWMEAKIGLAFTCPDGSRGFS